MPRLAMPRLGALRDRARLERAVKFSLSITLASLFLHLPGEEFDYAVFAPVEVSFIIFDRVGGSVSQSMMRVFGSSLGAIAGYLMVVACHGSDTALLALLACWGFLCSLGRASRHGYAACVAAWTAAIVSAAHSREVAFERITHSFLGAAVMLCVVHAVLPRWARDGVRAELAKVAAEAAGVHAAGARQWRLGLGGRSAGGEAGGEGADAGPSGARSPGKGESEPLTRLGADTEQVAAAEAVGARLRRLQGALSSVGTLHREACIEPEPWAVPPPQS